MQRQKPPTAPKDGELVRKNKMVSVRLKGYTKVGSVLSLVHYCYIKKGLYDVRMVYNGTGCGLNDSIWAPHFGLPTVKHTLCSLLSGYYQCNLDIGEMFLNFLLNGTTKQMLGVDIQYIQSKAVADAEWENGRPDHWERWCRNWMGLRDFLYRSI